ncbi:hypothetical protein BC828DRAFT_385181 [Blastocladiella britannica]|nr:hypothetical protein BC828DRAFT_385181 [Blastocladiella britannica]
MDKDNNNSDPLDAFDDILRSLGGLVDDDPGSADAGGVEKVNAPSLSRTADPRPVLKVVTLPRTIAASMDAITVAAAPTLHAIAVPASLSPVVLAPQPAALQPLVPMESTGVTRAVPAMTATELVSAPVSASVPAPAPVSVLATIPVPLPVSVPAPTPVSVPAPVSAAAPVPAPARPTIVLEVQPASPQRESPRDPWLPRSSPTSPTAAPTAAKVSLESCFPSGWREQQYPDPVYSTWRSAMIQYLEPLPDFGPPQVPALFGILSELVDDILAGQVLPPPAGQIGNGTPQTRLTNSQRPTSRGQPS